MTIVNLPLRTAPNWERWRVALARQQAAETVADIDRGLAAKKAAGADANYDKAVKADPESVELWFKRLLADFWRDRAIEEGLIPIVGKPGDEIGWRRPTTDDNPEL